RPPPLAHPVNRCAPSSLLPPRLHSADCECLVADNHGVQQSRTSRRFSAHPLRRRRIADNRVHQHRPCQPFVIREPPEACPIQHSVTAAEQLSLVDNQSGLLNNFRDGTWLNQHRHIQALPTYRGKETTGRSSP